MNGDNYKQRDVLSNVPANGRVGPESTSDFIHRDQEPRPMQEDVDSGKAEQVDRSRAASGHAGSLLDFGSNCGGRWRNWAPPVTAGREITVGEPRRLRPTRVECSEKPQRFGDH